MGKIIKTVHIPQFNLSYIEGPMPVFLQIYLSDDGTLDTGFVVANSDEEARVIGSVNGQILSSSKLSSLFSRLAMMLKLDSELKDS